MTLPRHRAKTYQTSIVAIPPRRVWEPIQAIRRRHDRQIHRWMPQTALHPWATSREQPLARYVLLKLYRHLHPDRTSSASLSTDAFSWSWRSPLRGYRCHESDRRSTHGRRGESQALGIDDTHVPRGGRPGVRGDMTRRRISRRTAPRWATGLEFGFRMWRCQSEEAERGSNYLQCT
jgi:hypothetical protein